MSRNVSILSVVVVMIVTVLATVAVAFAVPGEGSNGQAKVPICHKGHEITVAAPAVQAHIKHGDPPPPNGETELENGATEPENGTTELENGDTELENPEDACETAGAPPEEPSEDATLTTDATETATLPGGTISDVATLGTDVPDGTDGDIEFKLYGPFTTAPTAATAATDCVAANLVTAYDTDGISTKPVTNHNETGGTTNPYTSLAFTPTQPGIYQWTAMFTPDSGQVDPSGEIGCGEAAEQSVVNGGATPTLTTDATDATLPNTTNDVATLDVPQGTDGTIEFKLYGPFAADALIGEDDCVDPEAEPPVEGNLVFEDEQTVTDFDPENPTYTSDSYPPTGETAVAGKYQWVATFTPAVGESVDPSSSPCGEVTEQSNVSEATSTTATEQNVTLAGEIGEAGNLTDSATDTTNIEGTNPNDDTSAGTDSEDDVLYGNSSANKLLGRHGNDYLDGGKGRDRMVGGKQGDYINGADGKPGDVINGGIGTDNCVGDVGDEIKNCDGNVLNVPLPSESAAPAEAGN
jgi:hypothetical protein